jgi:hypothetical protein
MKSSSPQLINFHLVPASHGRAEQDIELVRISQDVTERFYKLLAAPTAPTA